MRALIVLALFGCQTAPIDPIDPIEPPPDLRPVTQLPGTIVVAEPGAIIAEHDLSTMPGYPTGVTVEPGTGRRLILFNHGVIRDQDGNDVWEGALLNDFGYTDLVAIREGQIALTTLSDGYLLDLASGALTPHFCYEPGWMEPEGQDPVQLSNAVTFDPLGGRIYAQPRTIENGGWGAANASFVAAYDQQGGEDITWWELETAFTANAMTIRESAETGPEMLLASGSMIHVFDSVAGELSAALDLSELGVTWIEGIAIDGDALLVIDGATYVLYELRRSALDL